MSRYHSYLNTTKVILENYSGAEPFVSYLKKYFSDNKKSGSRDRKQITHLCYSYFRTAHLLGGQSPEDKILKGLFLCSSQPDEILAALKPEWNDKVHLSLQEKYAILSIRKSIQELFPWHKELSDGINSEEFAKSFLIQPDLFLRIRPHHAKEVLLKIIESGIVYEFISPFALRLSNSFRADQFFELDKEVVVQDLSSQRVGEFMELVRRGRSDQLLKVWDCCAGSGGKSIMAFDLNPEIDLTVSDIRESILTNLKKRFKQAGIKKYKSFFADVVLHTLSPEEDFDVIIADVPCSGSGTWGRTPDQLIFFNTEKINEYAVLQKKIVFNAVQQLQSGGNLLYITCSVFRKENEDAVEFIKEKLHLRLIKMELIKGYDKKADTMFVARFQKPL